MLGSDIDAHIEEAIETGDTTRIDFAQEELIPLYELIALIRKTTSKSKEK